VGRQTDKQTDKQTERWIDILHTCMYIYIEREYILCSLVVFHDLLAIKHL
jgi:acetamidase/formamidase